MVDPDTTAARLRLPVDDTPVRDAALLYVAAGFAPVPVHGIEGERCGCGSATCDAAGKHPVGVGWQKRAGADVDTARRLFGRHRGNIGIVLGPAYVVIDIDDYHGGREALDQLGPLPPTLTQRSGSWQGEHRIYALGPGQDAREVTNRAIAPGLDVKTRTGQIVVAPSLHRSGHRYTWIDCTPPAPLPDAVYARICKRRVVPIRPEPAAAGGDLVRRARAYVAAMPSAISGAGGHAATWAVVRALRGWVARGLGEAEAVALLADYSARCTPPWSEAELQHKWTSSADAHTVPALADRPRATAAAAAATAAAPPAPVATTGPLDWRDRLIWVAGAGEDRPAKHAENAVVVLRYHPAWIGRVAWDEHAGRVVVTAPPWHESDACPSAAEDARPWVDSDSTRLSAWLRREVYGLDLGADVCDRAVQVAAEAHPVHPFRAWLDDLRWDGIERLPDWLSDYLGARASEYTVSVGVWWVLSAVARTYAPGCKADCLLILEGPQGAGKSTALKTLVGERWFSDSPLDLASKDAYTALRGLVCVELAELESLRRAEAARAKAFFSSAVDHYRPPYGRREVTVPRRCVFAGSVNHAVYLDDDTGARRYWPVRCGTIDIERLAAAREQLWAEAVARYRRGERWWPEGAEYQLCADEQAERTRADAWEDAVREYVALRDRVTVAQVWVDALKGELPRLDRGTEQRIGRVLRGLGLERRRVVVGGEQKWIYRPRS